MKRIALVGAIPLVVSSALAASATATVPELVVQ
jgi:hypothetical protein